MGAGCERQKLAHWEVWKSGGVQVGAAETPRTLLSERGEIPTFPHDPRGSELTYFGAEAALGRAEGGERRGEGEQREQQAAGARRGARHVREGAGAAGSAARPKPGARSATPRAPLSRAGNEFGFLERCPSGEEEEEVLEEVLEAEEVRR